MTLAEKTILLVGAGPANQQVIKHAQRFRSLGTRLVLVTPDQYWYYPAMAAEIMSGQYALANFRLDVHHLAERHEVEWIQDEASSLLLHQKKILTAAGRMINYDWASFAIGALPAEPEGDIPAEGSFPIRPARNVLEIRNELETLLELFPRKRLEIVILGGGVRGVEFALHTAHLMHHRKVPAGWKITLLEKRSRLLPRLPPRASALADKLLAVSDISVRTGANIQHIQSRRLVLEYGETLEFDLAIATLGLRVSELFRKALLSTNHQGAVKVENTLAIQEHPELFAAGECACFRNQTLSPINLTGAQKAGRLLTNNLLASIQGKALQRFKLPSHPTIITLGTQEAMLVWGQIVVAGKWVQSFKRWQDQRRMKNYQK